MEEKKYPEDYLEIKLKIQELRKYWGTQEFQDKCNEIENSLQKNSLAYDKNFMENLKKPLTPNYILEKRFE